MPRNPYFRNYQAKKTDSNQQEIMDTFRALGCTVRSLHETGKGMFDLIVAIDFLNVLVEVKDGLLNPSERELTEPQKEFNFYWQGLKAVVTTPFECRVLVAQCRDLIAVFRDAAKASGLPIAVCGSREGMYQPALTGR